MLSMPPDANLNRNVHFVNMTDHVVAHVPQSYFQQLVFHVVYGFVFNFLILKHLTSNDFLSQNHDSTQD